MSNLPPPPPPPSSGPPPPPPPGPGAMPYSVPVSYGGPRPAPGGLRTAAIVFMWLTVAANVFLTFASFNRKSVWDGFVDGNKSIVELDDADDVMAAALGLSFLPVLVTAILLAVWSHRTTSNAQALGAQVSPGLAAGGWFIPIGWYFVPFGQLRNAVRGRGDSSSIGWWQGLWIVATIGSGISANLFDDDLDQSATEVSDSLRNQSIGLAISTVVLVAATVAAMRALKTVDRATSG